MRHGPCDRRGGMVALGAGLEKDHQATAPRSSAATGAEIVDDGQHEIVIGAIDLEGRDKST